MECASVEPMRVDNTSSCKAVDDGFAKASCMEIRDLAGLAAIVWLPLIVRGILNAVSANIPPTLPFPGRGGLTLEGVAFPSVFSSRLKPLGRCVLVDRRSGAAFGILLLGIGAKGRLIGEAGRDVGNPAGIGG